jgi:hypothetical protein
MRFLSDLGHSNLLQVPQAVKQTIHNNLAGLIYIKVGAQFLEQRTKKKKSNKGRQGCHLQPCSSSLQLLPPQCVYQDRFRYQPYYSINGWPLASHSTCDSLDFTYLCSGVNLPIPGNAQKFQCLTTVTTPLSLREHRWHAPLKKLCTHQTQPTYSFWSSLLTK